MQPIVEAIEPLSAASRAGLQIGDVFLKVDGKVLDNFNDLREIVINSRGKMLIATIYRNGQIVEKPIQPVLSPIEDRNGEYDTIYRIGVLVVRFFILIELRQTWKCNSPGRGSNTWSD